VNGNVRQHFAIDLYIGLFEAMDKLAIANAVYAGSRINAGNPQAAKITLAIPAVAESIEERLEHGFIGTAKEFTLGAILPFSEFQHFFVSTMGIYLRSRSRHFLFPFREGGATILSSV